jgi:hypothetical protein
MIQMLTTSKIFSSPAPHLSHWNRNSNSIYNKSRPATIGATTTNNPCPAMSPNLVPEEESTTPELEVVAVEPAVVVSVKRPPAPPAEVPAAAVLAKLKNGLAEVESVPPTPTNVVGVLIEGGV